MISHHADSVAAQHDFTQSADIPFLWNHLFFQACDGSILEIIRRGDKYRNQQQYEKAIEVYREVLELDPNNIDAYYGIGYSNLKMGLNDKSIGSFMKAVRIDPYDPETHYNIGIVYFLIKEKGPAFEQYKILKVLNENYATRLLMYVDSLR